MARGIDGAKRNEWCKRLAKFEVSGLTVTAFCRRERVSQASFYYWAKRVRQTGDGVATQCTQQESRPEMTRDSVPNDLFEVVVDDSIRVRMPAGRLDVLAAFIKLLQASSPDAGSMASGRFQRIELATTQSQSRTRP